MVPGLTAPACASVPFPWSAFERPQPAVPVGGVCVLPRGRRVAWWSADLRGVVKLVHWVNGLLLVALFVGSALLWPALPDAVPTHVGLGGRPTRWTSPTLLQWFLLPIITTLTVAFLYWLNRVTSGNPHLINMPDKHQFLELPPARQAPIIERVQEFVYWITAYTIVIMGAVQWSMFRAAVTGSAGRDPMLILVMSFGILPLGFAYWYWYIQPEVDRQLREHRGER